MDDETKKDIHESAASALGRERAFVEKIEKLAAQLLAETAAHQQTEAGRFLLSSIVESSEDSIVSITFDAVITRWNGGAERLFGYTAQEAIGQPVMILIPDELENEEPGILERIRHGETLGHFETVRRRKDHTPVDVSLTVSPIFNAHGLIVGASKVARDITKRRRVEEALRASEERMRMATEATAVGIWERNVLTDALRWDTQMFRIYGIGMNAEILPHIFNAFEQGAIAGQHRFGGLGMGLAISQAIITAHEGAIRGESEGLNCGSTFTVVLLMIDAPATSASATEPGAVHARSRKLLIVEDHEATRQVLQRLLTLKGHQVTTAGSVKEAITIHGAERFDAVISDLGLPDGSGLDLMRELQRQRPAPGIALSGYGMEGDLRLTRAAGFFAHVVKPVNIDQLRQLIDQIPPTKP